MPQYLLKKIEALKPFFNIHLVEWANISDTFVVQKNKIRQLLSTTFYTLGEDKTQILKIIQTIRPDYIHLAEIPEMFMDYATAAQIYASPRPYLIFETTHTSDFNVANKVFFPDKFIFVCQFSKIQYANFDVPCEVVEFPIESIRFDKQAVRKKLGLDLNQKHIVIVGLFTPRKNQGYAFRLAKKLLNNNVLFHFIGNTADNFAHYWKPIIDQKPANCILWGERSDVQDFLQAGDLSLFPSEGCVGDKELNPLIIKESLENQIPLLMYNLDVYLGKYNNVRDISFLTGNIDQDSSKIVELLSLETKKSPITSILDAYLSVQYEPESNKILIHSSYSQNLFFKYCVIKEIDSEIPIYFWQDINLWTGGNVWCVPINGHNFAEDRFCNGFLIEFYDENKKLLLSKTFRLKPPQEKTKLNLSPFDCAYINYREFFDIKVYENSIIDFSNLNTVVDIGASVGLFTKYIATKNPKKIYALEPIQKAYDNLSNLCSDDQRITPLNMALDTASGTRDIYFTDENTTISRFINNFPTLNYNYGKTEVATITWKDMIRILEIKEVSLLKMDIEGHEYAIFQNFDAHDLSQIQQIILEFHFGQNGEIAIVAGKLYQHGFKVTFRKQSTQQEGSIHDHEGILFATKI